jgi:hypothetical protein
MDAKGGQYVVTGQQLKVFLEPDVVSSKYIDVYTLDGDRIVKAKRRKQGKFVNNLLLYLFSACMLVPIFVSNHHE